MYVAVRNSGLRVTWYSIEKDPVCRKVSEHIMPSNQLVHHANDTALVGDSLDSLHADLFIDTSNCQPWSVCNGENAKDFEDSRAQTVIDAHKLFVSLRNTNPQIKYIVENVVPAPHLSDGFMRMQEMYGKFTLINANKI